MLFVLSIVLTMCFAEPACDLIVRLGGVLAQSLALLIITLPKYRWVARIVSVVSVILSLCMLYNQPWAVLGPVLMGLLLLCFIYLALVNSSVRARPSRDMDYETRAYWSQYVDEHTSRDPKRFWELRNAFQRFQCGKVAPTTHNPHAESAFSRKIASKFINAFAKKMALTVFSESCSHADQSAELAGSRLYYDHKDVSMPAQVSSYEPGNLIKLVDVDYYLEEERVAEYLSHNCPIMMYTIQPDSVAKWDGDSDYQLKGENFVNNYRGHSSYTHKLWDWCVDTITLTHDDERGYHIVQANLERRKAGDDRYLIFIVPRHITTFEFGVDRSAWLEAMTGRVGLQRRRSVNLGNGIWSIRTSGDVSLWQEGHRVSYRLSESDFADCISGAKSKNVSLSVLKQITGLTNCHHLRDILLTIAPEPLYKERTIHMGDQPRTYVPLYSDVQPEVQRVPGTTCCPPVIDGCTVPAECKASDLTVVAQRIEGVRAPLTQKVPVVDGVSLDTLADEFCEHIARVTGGKVAPMSMEEIVEHATGRKVKEYSRGFEDAYVDLVWKSFQKAEAYPDAKDPRNISNVDKKHVVRYLQFTKRVSEALKNNTDWYAFGLSPEEVADRVYEVVSRTDLITETDFSRFDGTIGFFLRMVELSVYKSIIDKEYHEDLEKLFHETFFADFRTRWGAFYNCGTGRCSGSACTSCGNTVVNAAANYFVLRLSGLDSITAWKRLGLYGGDDGLTGYPSPAKAEEVMAALDLKFKSNSKMSGERVGFLGRFYIDPWTHNRSYHDIQRAAVKLHYSSSSTHNASMETMTWRKAVSLFVTDCNTPLLGDWARQVLRVIPDGVWQASWKDEQYRLGFDPKAKTVSSEIMRKFEKPIFPGPEPEECEDVLRQFIEDSPIDLTAYRNWLKALKKAKTLEEFPEPLWRVEFESTGKYAIEADGNILGPEPGPAKKSDCWMWAAGRCTRGATCKYIHDPAKESSAEICRSFARTGECPRERCGFRHVKEEITRGGSRDTKAN